MGYKTKINAIEFRFGPMGIWENDTIRKNFPTVFRRQQFRNERFRRRRRRTPRRIVEETSYGEKSTRKGAQVTKEACALCLDGDS